MKKKVFMFASMLLVSAVSVQADDAGKKIYTQKCQSCHAAGVAGAPKPGDKAGWEPRMAQGIDGLVASAKKGKNAMPPKGACMDCSDADLKAAIEYMTAGVK